MSFPQLIGAARGVELDELPEIRIAIVRTYTSEVLTQAISADLLLLGVNAEVVTLPYGAFELSDSFDEVLVAADPADLHPDYSRFLSGDSVDGPTKALSRLARLRQGKSASAHVTVLGRPPLGLELLDTAYGGVAGSGLPRAQQWDAALGDWAESQNGLASCLSLEAHGVETNARSYATTLQPFSMSGVMKLSSVLARQIAARRLPRAKCLVLDADNTLWGGVVGEDGVDGIGLGIEGDGRHFRDFQAQLLTLKNRGLLLAIVSKNELADVLAVFRENKAAVLSEADFVSIDCGWGPKHARIENLARQLGLGLDSLIFIDDSDLEVGSVRKLLPTVQTHQAPAASWELTSVLGQIPSLDQQAITDEDLQRTQMYQADFKRSEYVDDGDFNDYLTDLEISVSIRPISSDDLDRCAQLIGKTNQANLSLRRRSRSELSDFLGEDENEGWLVDVSDRFGPYGVVGVVLLASGPSGLTVDTLLLSCRVLGRGVEDALVAHACGRAAELGHEQLIAPYVAGDRNGLILDLLPGLGFVEIDAANGDDPNRYSLPLDDARSFPEWLEVSFHE